MKEIPDQDHIARYCNSTNIQDGEILAGAFMLRPGESYLSINWLECLKCTSREKEIDKLRKIYKKKHLFGKLARVGVLNVGEIRSKVITENPKIEILHHPESDDPSHSGIFHLDDGDEMVAELIREALQETYTVRQ